MKTNPRLNMLQLLRGALPEYQWKRCSPPLAMWQARLSPDLWLQVTCDSEGRGLVLVIGQGYERQKSIDLTNAVGNPVSVLVAKRRILAAFQDVAGKAAIQAMSHWRAVDALRKNVRQYKQAHA